MGTQAWQVSIASIMYVRLTKLFLVETVAPCGAGLQASSFELDPNKAENAVLSPRCRPACNWNPMFSIFVRKPPQVKIGNILPMSPPVFDFVSSALVSAPMRSWLCHSVRV